MLPHERDLVTVNICFVTERRPSKSRSVVDCFHSTHDCHSYTSPRQTKRQAGWRVQRVSRRNASAASVMVRPSQGFGGAEGPAGQVGWPPFEGGLGVRQRRQHAFVVLGDVGRSSEQRKKHKRKRKSYSKTKWGMEKKKLSLSPPLFPQEELFQK